MPRSDCPAAPRRTCPGAAGAPPATDPRRRAPGSSCGWHAGWQRRKRGGVGRRRRWRSPAPGRCRCPHACPAVPWPARPHRFGSPQQLVQHLGALRRCRHRPLHRDGRSRALDLHPDDVLAGAGLRGRGCDRGGDRVRCHGGRQWQCHEGWRSQRLLFTIQALLAQPAMDHVRVQAMTQGNTGHRRAALPGLLQNRLFEIGAVLAPQPAFSIDQSFHRLHDLLRGDDPRLPLSLQDGFTGRIRCCAICGRWAI